ncbi:TonB-dependent receptor [Flavobacterium covae]|uniref:TonB-dependent receptor n=1 Tax=Flavobacterium covae TaxID=2906076 RepID=UPI0007C1E6E2|nr:TonB-dependent receptor [Flavobacterium covae]AND64139.1 TonB-dependent receptor [Flavobacterium covae]
MKNMKNWVLVTMMFVCAPFFAQNQIMGTIQDETGALPGANVVIEGTRQNVSSAFDGGFLIETKNTKGNLLITYLGFETKKVAFTVSNGKADLGIIVLKDKGNVLGEVVIKSTVVDVAKDRKTPVAVSTIKAAEIREKLGTKEFPEILATTPSVYATKSGGGYGDSRVNIRGFDQKNIAVMINGVPVNDMENGSVFWSNWAGLSDVTTAMQVQRGLGSSKLAISSVGGTINVVTRTSDAKRGGTLSATIANNDHIKTLASYSTGKLENGLSASVLLSSTQGNGYVNGTKYFGQNYFIGLGYDINEKNSLQFTFTGAPQWHNQRSFANTIADYIKYGSNGEPNIKYNSDWGYLNGQEYSWATNYYHKPVASLNYDFKFNDKVKLSSVFYGSWGRGGLTGFTGKTPVTFKTASGLVPFNDFVAFNRGEYVASRGESVTPITGAQIAPTSNGLYLTDRTTGFTRRANINSHDWYGAIINLNTKLSKTLTLDFGVDARTYIGYHFRNVVDLLGADGFKDNRDINNPNRILFQTYSAKPSFNPWSNVKNQERIEYNNDGHVRWYGAFTQLEYSNDRFTAFFQGAVSQQGFKRVDTFTYKESDPLYSTNYKNLIGGNVKGGVNFNINEKMNVFVNSGYYSKQPFFNAVYPNNLSVLAGNLINEKILGLEGGYGFKSSVFNANLNVYYTSWKDRFQRQSDSDVTNVGGYYNFSGIQQVHKGIELEANIKPTDNFTINLMGSIGDWRYKNNVTSDRFDANNNQISGGKPETLYLDNLKVGDVAQTTASAGVTYEIFKGLKVDATYLYVDKLYASIDPTKFKEAVNKGTLQLPSYGLLDAGFSFKTYRVKESNDYFNFRVNLNNVLNTVYISESRSNIFADDQIANAPIGTTYASANRLYKGLADANQVFFGFGRTWNFTFSYNF